MSAKRRSAHSQPRTDVVSAPTTVSAGNSDGLLPASGVPYPQELAGVLERIAACRQLPENWDGEDAFSVPEEVASLEQLHWTTSGTAVLMTILGGIGTLWGSLVGAAVVLLVRDALTNAPEASGVVTGAIFVVIVLAFRRGLWPSLGETVRLLRARGPRLLGPSTTAPGPRSSR